MTGTGPAKDGEVTLYEFVESLSKTVAAIQDEVGRGQRPGIGHVLDHLEIALPVAMRMDDLGQTLVRSGEPGSATANVRLLIRAGEPGAANAPPDHPLEALGAIPKERLRELAQRRILSVRDFVRVAQTPSGRQGLQRMRLGRPVQELLDRADVLALPVPPKVALALLAGGVHSPRAFLDKKASSLAASLSRVLKRKVPPHELASWQNEARAGPSGKPPSISIDAQLDKRVIPAPVLPKPKPPK